MSGHFHLPAFLTFLVPVIFVRSDALADVLHSWPFSRCKEWPVCILDNFWFALELCFMESWWFHWWDSCTKYICLLLWIIKGPFFLHLKNYFLMETCVEVCVLCFQEMRAMKSLQEAFQKQLNEAAEKAEKQQATVSDSVSFLILVSLLLFLNLALRI